MNVFAILAKAAGLPVDVMEKILRAGAKALPDAAPDIEGVIDKMRDAVSPAHLVNLGAELVIEAKQIAGGHIDPHSHPSDGFSG